MAVLWRSEVGGTDFFTNKMLTMKQSVPAINGTNALI